MARRSDVHDARLWQRNGNSSTARRVHPVGHLVELVAEEVPVLVQVIVADLWPSICCTPTLIYDHTATHDINVDGDWRRRWATVSVPALMCSGDQTLPGMSEAADAVAAALPNATRRTLPGQGHRPTPEAMVQVLVEFLRP